MASAMSYAEMRLANLDENRRMLQELGVRMPSNGERVMLNKPKTPPKRPKPKVPQKIPELETGGEDREKNGDSGRSFRFRLKPKNYREMDDYIWEAPSPKPRLPVIRPDNSYGSIRGIEVGQHWDTRVACSADLIHRPTVAGIHGGPDGAYSVALSGGYEDDVDFGESFTYTGEGGRDLKGTPANPKNLRTAPQSKDQSLERGNLALSRSVETQNPVRVVRGYKLDSDYAPDFGYRYDGLYQVKKYWAAMGKSGFKVFKFAFVRCDPETAPWTKVPEVASKSPTSPTTPSSMPQTGVEACEAPSIDAEDSDDHPQMEEAKKGAKQPEERGRKKVSFNPEDSVRFFETEREEEEKPGRMATRSSSKIESEESEEKELKPPPIRERSKRTVKPTAKIIESILQKTDRKVLKPEDSPIDLNKATRKSDTDEETLKKASKEEETVKNLNEEDVSKSPKTDKSSKTFDSESKRRSPSESRSRKRSVSPERKKDGSLSPEDLSRKSWNEKSKKSPRSSPEGEPRKRSISPEYPPVDAMPKSSTEETPRKRSISPEYPPEDLEERSSVEKPRKRSTSPEYPPEDLDKRAKSSLKKKRPKSPTDNASNKQSKPSRCEKSPKKKDSNCSPKEPAKKSTKSPKKEESPKIPMPPKSFKKSSPPSKQSVSKSKPQKSPEQSQRKGKDEYLKSKKRVSPEKSSSKVSGYRKESLSPEIFNKPKTESKEDVPKVPKRSHSPASSSDDESTHNTVPSKKKSPRSRGKKLEELGNSIEEKNDFSPGGIKDASTSPKQVKRKVGRPRKTLPTEVSDNEPSPDIEDAPTSPESVEGEVSVKRKVGLPRKTPPEEVSDSERFSESLEDTLSPESVEGGVLASLKRGRPKKISSEESATKKLKKDDAVPETFTPPETETSNSNSSSPPSPASSASSRCESPSSEAADISDDDVFPSDSEILNMMRFSLSSCSNDSRTITVRMVNGKWVEEEEPSRKDTTTNQENPVEDQNKLNDSPRSR